MRIKYIGNFQDQRVKEFDELIRSKYPELLTEENPEMYLVAGGDGAMLHAIHRTVRDNIPYIGKALGTFNFLMNYFDDDVKTLDELLNDEINLDIFETFSIKAVLDGNEIGETANDVVLGDKISDYFNFDITTSDGDFNNFDVKGSGLCISTAIGSTAFNFNNNGRILPLDSQLLSITGIACNRYLNDIIPIQEIRIKSSGAKIFLSNIESGVLNSGSELVLKIGSLLKLAFINKKQFLNRRIELGHRFRK